MVMMMIMMMIIIIIIITTTGHEGPDGGVDIALLFLLNSALDGGWCQRHVPAALPPEKTRYPLYRKLCGPQGWSGRVRKITPTQGFHPRTVQKVASRYTD
jgi:hypothetical protein